MESYYDYEDNISLEEFFKNSYYTFLWIRTNINSLYNIFAETAAWDNHNNLSIAESQLFSDNDTLANLIKIDKITFYYDNQFQIEFSLNGEYYNIYFSKDKKISYEY